MSEQLPSLYQSFIHLSRYSRWLDDEERRETWEETVNRYFDFFDQHLKEECNYIIPLELREELQTAVLNLEIMPSMRALMTAGEALRRDNVAGYNCSYASAGKVKSFDEILFQNGTRAKFVLPVRALRLLEDEQADQSHLKSYLNSPSQLSEKQQVENLLLSNVTISSARLQRLWLSEVFAGAH